ncbi:hypothetical protein [uncultured Flavobacterium sp.]|uniref:hypothetical protein n=1 Tax=uncultured Flavobacterium sp. TaxID=165435 RepID=UPI000AA8374E|nr:hypothetical protein [uncultured Flavobacterium sp.]
MSIETVGVCCQTENEEIHTCPEEETEENENDICNSFCNCDCCRTIIPYTSNAINVIVFESVNYPVYILNIDENIFLSSYLNDIWHPPKQLLF